jgi:hypothetical protein
MCRMTLLDPHYDDKHHAYLMLKWIWNNQSCMCAGPDPSDLGVTRPPQERCHTMSDTRSTSRS